MFDFLSNDNSRFNQFMQSPGATDVAMGLLASRPGERLATTANRGLFAYQAGQTARQQAAAKQQMDALKMAKMQAETNKYNAEATELGMPATASMGKPQPKDYTPESWALYVSTNDSSHLRRAAPIVTKTDIQKNLIGAGFKEGTPEYKEMIKQSLKPKDNTFDQEGKLRDKYVTLSADYRKQRDAHQRVLASAENPSPAGDLALVFNFMKVLDPSSVVRESEFRTAQDAKAAIQKAAQEGAEIPNFVMGALNRLGTGQIMLPDQRKDFVTRSGLLFTKADRQHEYRANSYKNLAKAYDLDPSRVVMDLTFPQEEYRADFGAPSEEQQSQAGYDSFDQFIVEE